MPETTSEFLRSLEDVDDLTRDQLVQTYNAWDAATRLAADKRAKFARTLDDDFSPDLIVSELQHGLEHTANLAFVSTLRQCAEAIVMDCLRSPSYGETHDEETERAISRFHSTLTSTEQALILRAFAIEMMVAFGDILENGAEYYDCPIDWILVNPHTGNQVAGELHAEFDGDPDSDETYFPRKSVVTQGT